MIQKIPEGRWLRVCSVKGCDADPRVVIDGRYYCNKHSDQAKLTYVPEQTSVRAGDGSVVYFLEAVGLNAIKVGMTFNFRKRWSGIQSSLPVELKQRALWEQDTARKARAAEKALHKLLAPHRIRGEWFRMEGPVLEILLLAEAGRWHDIEFAIRIG